jgi:hypothetical protein
MFDLDEMARADEALSRLNEEPQTDEDASE